MKIQGLGLEINAQDYNVKNKGPAWKPNTIDLENTRGDKMLHMRKDGSYFHPLYTIVGGSYLPFYNRGCNLYINVAQPF